MKYRDAVIDATSLAFLGSSLVKRSQLEDFNVSKFKSWTNSKFESVM